MLAAAEPPPRVVVTQQAARLTARLPTTHCEHDVRIAA